jgi:hypothetical protein
MIKRASLSNSNNPLENFDKLRKYALRGSVLLKKQAKKKGIVLTIIREGIVYKVFPDGKERVLAVNKNFTDQSVIFEPIALIK